MLTINYQSAFKKDYNKIVKRGYNMSLFFQTVGLLVDEKELPPKYREHGLKGEYEGFRECHIQPDWLLIYSIDKDNSILSLYRTGTHSDLFG